MLAYISGIFNGFFKGGLVPLKGHLSLVRSRSGQKSKYSVTTFGELETPHSARLGPNSAESTYSQKYGEGTYCQDYKAHTKQRSSSR